MLSLLIDYAGEQKTLVPGDKLVFGRDDPAAAGDRQFLPLDTNEFLHRRAGAFVFYKELWWVQNLGSRVPLTLRVRHDDVKIPPGGAEPIVDSPAEIVLSTGGRTYALICELDAEVRPPVADDESPRGKPTVDWPDLRLSRAEHLLLVALAEPWLAGAAHPSVPEDSSIAVRFGWSARTFDRTLERVCDKFAEQRVSGLEADARDRRRALVHHALQLELVVPTDLASLPPKQQDTGVVGPSGTGRGGVFISYRRQDQPHLAGRLYDRLRDHLGHERVFIDVSSIEPGLDFVDVIAKTLANCSVMLVLIGKDWHQRDADGRSRLEDPNDYVRLELQLALNGGSRVIPILVDDAVMPAAADLPDPLRALERRNSLVISHRSFARDVELLIETIDRVLQTTGS